MLLWPLHPAHKATNQKAPSLTSPSGSVTWGDGLRARRRWHVRAACCRRLSSNASIWERGQEGGPPGTEVQSDPVWLWFIIAVAWEQKRKTRGEEKQRTPTDLSLTHTHTDTHTQTHTHSYTFQTQLLPKEPFINTYVNLTLKPCYWPLEAKMFTTPQNTNMLNRTSMLLMWLCRWEFVLSILKVVYSLKTQQTRSRLVLCGHHVMWL